VARKYFGLVLALLSLSCSAAAQEPKSAAQEVSFCDLVKAPEQFSGKRIRVRAIYKYGFEIQRLDSPVCCPERGPAIWVEIDTELGRASRKLLHKFPEGMGLALATFVGTFEGDGPYGDGGYRFKFTVDEIRNLEATARASAHGEPAWVPKTCGVSEVAQEYKPSDFAHFTRPPTEHQIVVIEEPFLVRSVRGTVRFRKHPGEPLANVLFELQGPGPNKKIRRSTSDQAGRFKIGHTPAGSYRFKATRDGFTSVVGWIEVSNKAEKKADLEIEMGIGN
jgi:hypothetical protein